jgi:hypothetical protein
MSLQSDFRSDLRVKNTPNMNNPSRPALLYFIVLFLQRGKSFVSQWWTSFRWLRQGCAMQRLATHLPWRRMILPFPTSENRQCLPVNTYATNRFLLSQFIKHCRPDVFRRSGAAMRRPGDEWRRLYRRFRKNPVLSA